MVWYTPASWEQLRTVADDREALGTLAEFERKAERLIDEFEAEGFAVEKVVLDIDDLVRWCRENGFRVDQRGRSAYGAILLAGRDQVEGRA